MANVVEIILKGVDKASSAFKSAEKSSKGFGDTLLGVVRTAGSAALAVGATGAAMKKAFDLGREGAVLEQTEQSFGFLLDTVEAAPDLFDQLTAASHGTLTEFELQSSTMKLLAGASGDLATQLANATPRLLEIAKASNKLNPSLGDTAFLYESIATGVKRAQPLILDNLGLTLKVGEANKAYADQLGKSVEELTAQEKAIAILNATLEAGDTLIDQVGGNTEALTDEFDQLFVNIKQAVDEIKKGLVPWLKNAAHALNLILTHGSKTDAALLEHAKTVIETGASYKEFAEQMTIADEVASQDLVPGASFAAEVLERFGLVALDDATFLEQYGDALFNVGRETEDNTGATFELLDALEDQRTTVTELIPLEETLAENTRLIAENSKEAAERSSEFLSAIDKDIKSPLMGMISDIQFFIQTEGKFVGILDRIRTLLDPKSAGYDPDKALQLSKETLAAFVDTNVELGNMSAEEGIETLKEVGFTTQEATDLIVGTDGLTEALAGIDDVNLELDNLNHVKQTTEFILADLNSISGTQWQVPINWSSGTVPSPAPGPVNPPSGPQPDTGGGGGGGGGSTGGGTGTGPQPNIVINNNVDSRIDVEEIAQQIKAMQ